MSKALSRIGGWATIYVVLALTGGVVTAWLSRATSHPVEQVAFVVALPVILSYIVIRIFLYFMLPHEHVTVCDKPRTPALTATAWFIYAAACLLPIIIISLTSMVIYYIMGLTWAAKGMNWIGIGLLAAFIASFLLALVTMLTPSFTHAGATIWFFIGRTFHDMGDDAIDSLFHKLSAHR